MNTSLSNDNSHALTPFNHTEINTKVEHYAHGYCHILAAALHSLTGLPIRAALCEDFQTGRTCLVHAWVGLPQDRALDSRGVSWEEFLLEEYPEASESEKITISVEDVLLLGEGSKRKIGKKVWNDALEFAKEVISRNGGVDLLKANPLLTPRPAHQLDTFLEHVQTVKDVIYEKIINAFDCGPFDGGCVLFANALRDVIGGEVFVLINENGRADHAAVMLDGMLVDFDGPLDPLGFMVRFSENESTRICGFRPMAPGDLSEAAADKSIQSEVECLLRRAIRGEVPTPPRIGSRPV